MEMSKGTERCLKDEAEECFSYCQELTFVKCRCRIAAEGQDFDSPPDKKAEIHRRTVRPQPPNLQLAGVMRSGREVRIVGL